MTTLEIQQARGSCDVPGNPNQDALLQASRRVDFRFLLPEPDLGHTAYVGRRDADLIESLRLFTRSLAVLDRDSDAPARSCSLVVANNPSYQELRQAAAAISPAGFLYIEVDRRRFASVDRPGRDGSHPRTIDAHLAALRQHGFSQHQVHWHWPNFEACNEIIPLRDRAAGLCALRRRGSGWRARWKRLAGRLLLETLLLARCVPCCSITALRKFC